MSDQQADKGSFFHFIKELVAVRKDCPEVGIFPVQVLEQEGNEEHLLVSGYASIEGDSEQVSLVLFHNFSEQPKSTTVHPKRVNGNTYTTLFGNGSCKKEDAGKLAVDLPGYGYLWVRV